MKILLLGPKREIDEKRTGGTIVLFDSFINELINQNIDFIIIDTNKSNYKNTIRFQIKIGILTIKIIGRIVLIGKM